MPCEGGGLAYQYAVDCNRRILWREGGWSRYEYLRAPLRAQPQHKVRGSSTFIHIKQAAFNGGARSNSTSNSHFSLLPHTTPASLNMESFIDLDVWLSRQYLRLAPSLTCFSLPVNPSTIPLKKVFSNALALPLALAFCALELVKERRERERNGEVFINAEILCLLRRANDQLGCFFGLLSMGRRLTGYDVLVPYMLLINILLRYPEHVSTLWSMSKIDLFTNLAESVHVIVLEIQQHYQLPPKPFHIDQRGLMQLESLSRLSAEIEKEQIPECRLTLRRHCEELLCLAPQPGGFCLWLGSTGPSFYRLLRTKNPFALIMVGCWICCSQGTDWGYVWWEDALEDIKQGLEANRLELFQWCTERCKPQQGNLPNSTR